MKERVTSSLVLSVFCLCCLKSYALIAGSPQLTSSEVSILVANVPLAISVAQAGGCPQADYSSAEAETNTSLPIVQLRDVCPASGNGMLANYVIDLTSGLIWSDIDQTTPVDSPRLQVLRNRFLVGPSADLNGDNKIDCSDVAIVKAAFGKKSSQAGYDVLADVNMDGVVDIKDLAFVTQHLPAGTKCP